MFLYSVVRKSIFTMYINLMNTSVQVSSFIEDQLPLKKITTKINLHILTKLKMEKIILHLNIVK